MILIKKILAYTAIVFLSVIVATVCLEVVTRCAVGIYTGDINSFKYGFNSNIRLERSGKQLTFKQPSTDSTEQKNIHQENTHSIRIAAFGGSTTIGYTCPGEESSWPEELEQTINAQHNTPLFKVLNYGKGYTNSDYAVEKLLTLDSSRPVDYVLWANFINESKILFEGVQRNHAVLSESFADILLDENVKDLLMLSRTKIFLQRLDKTFQVNLLFYRILSDISSATKKILIARNTAHSPPAVHQKRKKTFAKITSLNDYWLKSGKTERATDMAIENYRLNFISAKQYCDAKDIQIILIKLPVFMDMLGTNLEPNMKAGLLFFMEKIYTGIEDIAAEYNVPLIDVNDHYQSLNSLDNFFCDSVHQKKVGNKLTAEIITTALLNTIIYNIETMPQNKLQKRTN